jgi:hybrid cluster-associated redox disulfide protein
VVILQLNIDELVKRRISDGFRERIPGLPIMKPFLSREITVKDLLDRCPQVLQLFMEMGLLCPGCPAEAFHTLEDVAREYHLDLNQLLQRIDMVINGHQAPAGNRC